MRRLLKEKGNNPSAIETVLEKTAEIVEDFSREIDAVLSSKAKE